MEEFLTSAFRRSVVYSHGDLDVTLPDGSVVSLRSKRPTLVSMRQLRVLAGAAVICAGLAGCGGSGSGASSSVTPTSTCIMVTPIKQCPPGQQVTAKGFITNTVWHPPRKAPVQTNAITVPLGNVQNGVGGWTHFVDPKLAK